MLNDTTQRPRILLIFPQGIPVPTKVPHQRSYCFDRSGLRRTVPSRFNVTYLKGIPKIRVRIYSNSDSTHKDKAYKSSNWKHYELFLRYTPLIFFPSRVASSVIRWEELTIFWNAGLCFAFVFTKCRGKQESPPTFILSNKERKKAQKNSFFSRYFWVRGVDYKKGRY